MTASRKYLSFFASVQRDSPSGAGDAVVGHERRREAAPEQEARQRRVDLPALGQEVDRGRPIRKQSKPPAGISENARRRSVR